MQQTERFVKGAIILSFAGIIAKIVSAFYRIPLVYFVGDEGIGYYQTVFPVFSILISAGFIGIPNALSKLIAEEIAVNNYKAAKQTFKNTMIISLILGLCISILMIFGAKSLIELMGWNEGTKYVIWGFALSPIFVSISGVIKGYFQGIQIMYPTALTQIIENSTKVIIGITLVYLLLAKETSLPIAVGGAAIGTSIGFIISALFMIFIYNAKGKKYVTENIANNNYNNIPFLNQAVQIFKLAIPVSIAAAVFSIMNVIDSFTLFNGLAKIGYDNKYATEIIGQMGKSYSVINFPLSISVALSISIIPAISESAAINNYEELKIKIKQGLKLAIVMALPAAVGLFMLAKPIMTMLYPTSPDGYIYLQTFSICLVFMIIGQTVAGILQGISKQNVPIIALALAIITKLILNYLLIPTSLEGIGAAIASIIYYIVFLVVNYGVLKKHISFQLDKSTFFLKPFLATLAMLIGIYFMFPGILLLLSKIGISKGLGNALSTLITVIIGAIIYFTLLIRLKTFTKDELTILPKYKKIEKLFNRKNNLF